MKHYRAILLVYAADTQPIYHFFRHMVQAYMFESSDIKVFFTYGENVYSFSPQDYDIINSGIKDFMHGQIWVCNKPQILSHYNPVIPMLRKTTNAIKKIYDTYSSDFFIRTNMSTFWVWDRLLKTLDTLPLTGCLSGATLGDGSSIHGSGMIVNGYMAQEMAFRESELIAQDRIQTLIPTNKFDWYMKSGVNPDHPKVWSKNEDRILSEFFNEVLGATLLPLNTMMVLNKIKTEQQLIEALSKADESDSIDHFRIKSDRDRLNVDSLIAKNLCNHYYGKPVAWDFEHNLPLNG